MIMPRTVNFAPLAVPIPITGITLKQPDTLRITRVALEGVVPPLLIATSVARGTC